MEACDGADARIAKHLFSNEERKCHIACSVTDNDASACNVLAREVPGSGLLNTLHMIVIFLADKGHRARGHAHVLFTRSHESAADGCRCTRVDAERVKRGLSWTLHLHWSGTHKELKKAMFTAFSNVTSTTRSTVGTGESLRREQSKSQVKTVCDSKDAKFAFHEEAPRTVHGR